MKLRVFFFASASAWHSVNGREQYLRSVQSSTQCEGSTVGWVDSYGDGCDWYEVNDLPGCPKHGNLWGGGMGVADDNCCFCAGTGAPSPPTPAPTNHPTVSQIPTVSAAPSVCTGNTAGWVDDFGDGCDWYERSDLVGCPYYGNLYDGGMGVANDNCCFCAGGTGVSFESFHNSFVHSLRLTIPLHSSSQVPTSPTVQWPTYIPTVTQVPTMSAAPSVCTGNTAGWVDVFGEGCDWYEVNDLPGCSYWGPFLDGGMGLANDNCCFCAGTGVPTSPPVPHPTASPIS